MKLTLIYDEEDISLNIAARAVTKYIANPCISNVAVDNDIYIVKNNKGTQTYTVKSYSAIKRMLYR